MNNANTYRDNEVDKIMDEEVLVNTDEEARCSYGLIKGNFCHNGRRDIAPFVPCMDPAYQSLFSALLKKQEIT